VAGAALGVAPAGATGATGAVGEFTDAWRTSTAGGEIAGMTEIPRRPGVPNMGFTVIDASLLSRVSHDSRLVVPALRIAAMTDCFTWRKVVGLRASIWTKTYTPVLTAIGTEI
jgi:hypothetical protein